MLLDLEDGAVAKQYVFHPCTGEKASSSVILDKSGCRIKAETGDASDNVNDQLLPTNAPPTDEMWMAEEVRKLCKAATLPLPNDSDIPPLPEWLDIGKLKIGQTFGSKYLYGLNYSQTLSLVLLFAFPNGLKPLIYTEKSHTPYLAFERYLSTALKVKSWYETEIWKTTSEGYKNLKAVRSIHQKVSDRLNRACSEPEIQRRSDLEQKLKTCDTALLCPLSSILKKDFDAVAATTATTRLQPAQEAGCSVHIYFNQLEMALTQFGFYGLMLLYPDKFAAKNATEEELEGFVHLWRYIGYTLGIDDEYNMCSGQLEMVRRRSALLVECIVRPAVLQAATYAQWEHMARCALLGIEKFTKLVINFEATMLYFCWVLRIRTPHLENHVGWKEMAAFNLTKLVMTEAHKVPGFARFFNYRVRRNIEEAAAARRLSQKGTNRSQLRSRRPHPHSCLSDDDSDAMSDS